MDKQKAKDRNKTSGKGRGFATAIRRKGLLRGGFPFPDHNPNPVLRISAKGKVLYSNDASEILLQAWQWQAGKALPDKWNRYVQAAISERRKQHQRPKLQARHLL
ncbi:MAG: hypothetical protein FVQ79_05915 [Planctomycetes bacterium]|nr:hypothetical protein [Planctomycetota bacterium]